MYLQALKKNSDSKKKKKLLKSQVYTHFVIFMNLKVLYIYSFGILF